MSRTFEFPVKYARRMPDPVFNDEHGTERHFLYVPVSGVPQGLPLDPNPRIPNIRRSVYREIRRSLVLADGRFHLKHKGITLVAAAVEKQSDTKYEVRFDEGQGILDGGHTYELIQDALREGDLAENQFVKFEIVTRAVADWIPDMAGGLNTSVQVEEMSLDNLKGKFDWLKEVLEEGPMAGRIAYMENEDKDFDARDLVSVLTCFNIALFPRDDSERHPTVAYTSKANTLRLFEQSPAEYQKLKPLVVDILLLHDTVSAEARRFWNDEGGTFGRLAFVESRKRGAFIMPFSGEQVEYRLMTGALYPILAAFRWMVQEDSGKTVYCWKGGFENVLALWRDSAVELLRATKQSSDELGRNPNALGKSKNHWAGLFNRIAKRDLVASGAGR